LSSIYEVRVDPNAENNCHAFELSFVGYNKSVLEVGCSTGYMTKVLAERGCDVVGIELDPEAANVAEQWADRVVVGNIDDGEVWNYVKDESFDVVLLGDVLEHLLDPLGSLQQAVRKLKPSGFVVTSLPNVAHGDVCMTLMQGTFRYREVGLLDRTHIKFFTLETIRELLTEAGLVVADTKRVVVPLFTSELGVKREDVPHEAVEKLLMDPEIETYQFVMKSVRDDGTRTLAELGSRVNELSDHVQRESARLALVRKKLRDYDELERRAKSQQQTIKEQQRYVEALEGHNSGLQHNNDILNEAMTQSEKLLAQSENARLAVEANYQAVLAMKKGQRRSPLRRVYNKITRSAKKTD
jgi:2-polyprenyl-3-methyl-5-hydroxy-6-metoxy-1,4-benzoquinol methylase